MVQAVKDRLLFWAPDLSCDDFIVTSSGETGEDLKMSPRARLFYNYSIECKNTEAINIWKAYEQATTHVKEDRTPLLVFSRNRSEIMVCLTLENFLKLTR